MPEVLNRSAYGARVRRKNVLRTLAASVVLTAVVCLSAFFFANWRNRRNGGRQEILEYWNSGDFAGAFEASGKKLLSAPMDFHALSIHGFSAFQIAVAQINAQDTERYIDECIRSLRKALLCKEARGDYRIHYVLGKAYYHKGSGYEDQAIRWLLDARDGGFSASDMPELLGLAWAAVHEWRASVAAFSEALSPGREAEAAVLGDATPQDLLLLNIARSYIALEETEPANAYLVRLLETSRDSASTTAARLLLGEIMEKNGDPAGARAQYLAILEKDGENADARFRLGELYASAGEIARARAEWRRVLRQDPAHRLARIRLNI